MGRLVDLDELVSARIVAARLGWPRIQALHNARAGGFPEPVKTLSRTSLWLWPEIREWALGKGWKPWPGEGRVMVEPDSEVPAQLLFERLSLSATEVREGLEVSTGPQVEPPLYRWGDAEELWHQRANRPRTR